MNIQFPPAALISPHSRLLFVAFAATLIFAGCTPRDGSNESMNDLRASCFDVTANDGTVHLLYGRSKNKDAALELFWKMSKAPGSNWSQSVRIPTAHAPPGGHHRGNDPQIAAWGDRLMAVWTAKGGGAFGSGRIGVALSSDGGKTWRPGPSPASSDARDDVGYRFPATAADDRAFHLVWIHAEDKERSLRYARLDFDSSHWNDPVVIDSTSCACCWNELKVGSDGKPFVLYRDDQPKDMALAVSEDGGKTWQRTAHVGEFNWEFKGCPHVGGGLAVGIDKTSGSDTLFATVWSGDPEHMGAYSLNSQNSGHGWSDMMKMGASGEAGRHTDAAAASALHAAVAWDQQLETQQTIYIQTTSDGGKNWSKPRSISSAGTTAKYPRLVVSAGQLFVLWSEFDGEQTPRIRFTQVERQ